MFAVYLRSRSGLAGRDLIAQTRTQAMANDHVKRHAFALKAYIESRPAQEQRALWRIYD